MPIGEAIVDFIGEVFAQGFLDGVIGLVRRLGAVTRSLLIPALTYRAALRGSWNRRVGLLVIAVVVLLSLLVA